MTSSQSVWRFVGSLTWIDDCPFEPLWPGRFKRPGWRPVSVQRQGWYESIQASPSALPLPGEGLPCLTQDCAAPGFYSKWERAHCSNAASVNPAPCSPGNLPMPRTFLSSLIFVPPPPFELLLSTGARMIYLKCKSMRYSSSTVPQAS